MTLSRARGRGRGANGPCARIRMRRHAHPRAPRLALDALQSPSSGDCEGVTLPVSFWSDYQPGFRATSAKPGTPAFFADVERERYSLEPHISAALGFSRWANKDVLEAGCGIGTDGSQFASAGARYTGVDQSEVALDLARRRFELEGQEGNFVNGFVTKLPFRTTPSTSWSRMASSIISPIPIRPCPSSIAYSGQAGSRSSWSITGTRSTTT